MKSKSVDMVGGSLWVNIIKFAIPVILTGILQLLFNACDLVVVGRFAGKEALAAVGATASLTNLLVNGCVGLSVGANVLAARFFGANNKTGIDKIVHTAVALSLISGVILAVLGVSISKACLEIMDTPADVINLSALYMKIYFLGMPAAMLYNFCAAILRAQGNTKKPLVYLTIAGIINVVLNLILVVFFDMSVAGVAIATTTSQCVSALLIVRFMRRKDQPFGLKLRKIKVHGYLLKEIFRIGIPAGVNGMLFSVSNVQIQSSINSFGAAAVAGSAASGSIEGFVYMTQNSMHQAALNFTGQNIGAGNHRRIPKIMWTSFVLAVAVGIVAGVSCYLMGPQLLSLYTTDAEAISIGMVRLTIILLSYFTCGCMEVLSGTLRGMGYSLSPMFITLLGVCGLRIVWVNVIFKQFRYLGVLFLSYPVSWLITLAVLLLEFFIIIKGFIEKSEINKESR